MVKLARLDARLFGSANTPSLEDLHVEGSGDAGFAFSAVGRVDDLMSLDGVAVQIKSTIDLAQLTNEG